MANKGLTPLQKEWEKQYNLAKRRAREWKRKFHAVIDLPEKPKRVTPKAIERLKNLKWKNISPKKKEKAQKEYEKLYEQSSPEVYQPKPEYTPPTEEEYLENPEPQYGPEPVVEDDEEDFENWKKEHDNFDWVEPEEKEEDYVDSSEEIERWIEDIINAEVSDDRKEDESVKETLRFLLENARRQYDDDKDFLNHLEDNAPELISCAARAKAKYKSGYESNDQSAALNEFATILNNGNPLTQEQAFTLETEGYVDF